MKQAAALPLCTGGNFSVHSSLVVLPMNKFHESRNLKIVFTAVYSQALNSPSTE